MEEPFADRVHRLLLEAFALELGAEVLPLQASDGSLTVPIALGAGTWQMYVRTEPDWITLATPLFELTDDERLTATLTMVLRRNHDTWSVSRFALQGRMLALRADYPRAGFSDEGFRRAGQLTLRALRHAIMDLGLRGEL